MSKPLISGLMQVGAGYDREMLSRSFGNLRSLCDRLIILEDKISCGYTSIADEVIHVANFPQPFHDYANRLTLYVRGAAHDCPLLVSLDADETFEPGFTRNDLNNLFIEAHSRGCEMIEFQLCEMWNETQYRIDGIWGQKRKIRAMKNPLMNPEGVSWRGNHMQRLHQIPLTCGDIMQTDIRILHWGMMSPELRAKRVAKLQAQDPNNEFQDDYTYLTKTEGIKLKEL